MGYPIPFAPFPEEPPEWEPQLINGVQVWVLVRSLTSPHNYNCSEYTARKLEGKRPRLAQRPPATNPQVTTQQMEQWLTDRGFTEQTPAADGSLPDSCTCKPPPISRICGVPDKACVVLYFEKPGPAGAAAPRNPAHVALYDPRYCDWGGKEAATGAIRRFRNPEDYLKIPVGPTTELYMTFYCGPPPTSHVDYPDDDTFHAAARYVQSDGTFPSGISETIG